MSSDWVCGVALTGTGWNELARRSSGADAAGGIRAILVKPHRAQDGTVGTAPVWLDGGVGTA